MSQIDDIDYFRMRAQTERAAAGKAQHGSVAETHRAMATEYEKLIAEKTRAGGGVR